MDQGKGLTIPLTFSLVMREPVGFFSQAVWRCSAFSKSNKFDNSPVLPTGGLYFSKSRYLASKEPQVIPPIHTPAANCCSTAQSYRTLEIEMSWQVRVQMAGLAAKGYTRAAVSCTFSTSSFQNSRNEVLALLAEAFGNPSVWSQHVTKGIMNLVYSITSFVTS